jgi:hypothetical protein
MAYRSHPQRVILSSAPGLSLAETYDATISSTTEVTLNASTTMIEVSAIDEAIMMKWGTSDATTADFDHVIAAGETRVFAVPAGVTAVNFIEQTTTAILAMSEH